MILDMNINMVQLNFRYLTYWIIEFFKFIAKMLFSNEKERHMFHYASHLNVEVIYFGNISAAVSGKGATNSKLLFIVSLKFKTSFSRWVWKKVLMFFPKHSSQKSFFLNLEQNKRLDHIIWYITVIREKFSIRKCNNPIWCS